VEFGAHGKKGEPDACLPDTSDSWEMKVTRYGGLRLLKDIKIES
jgi:hypothetical protein